MPLLDRLKSENVASTSYAINGEEWMSLSAAIGVEVERQALPVAGSYSPATGPSASTVTDTLWPKLLRIVSQEAVDQYVSHQAQY